MKAVSSSLLICIWASFWSDCISAHSPPQLLPTSGDPQKVVTPGTVAVLPCPVHGDRDTLIFEWYKDKESLMTFGGHRLRVTPNGALRIKETVPDDTGLYTCRAVNGFGSVEHNTTLVVLDDDEEYEDVSDDADAEEGPSSKDDTSPHKISPAAKPHLLYVTQGEEPLVRKSLGSPLHLRCVATGHPRPHITWVKDGKELPEVTKRGRWSLRLNNLQVTDSGNYTCLVNNVLGTASHTFLVDVAASSDGTRGKPQLTVSHPSNNTVEQGSTAMLQCLVKSDVPPHIQWLKRVEEAEMNEDEFIEVGGENFRVLKASEVMLRADGTFLNKLVIRDTEEKDSGKYVCLGANTMGYSFRSAYLTVLPAPTDSTQAEALPFPIVVAVIVVGVATVAGIIALLVYCRSRRPRSRGSSTGVPMVTKDAFFPFQRASSSSRCGPIGFASSRGRPEQQVTVYVPSCSMTPGHHDPARS